MTTTNIIPHKRKEYIDLAKGICNLLAELN